jgi:hypothetical protein
MLSAIALKTGRGRCVYPQRPRFLAGLYVGNPKRTTPRPTAEALLGAFRPTCMTNSVFNSQNLPENDRTMRLHSWFGHFEKGLKELAPRNARFDLKARFRRGTILLDNVCVLRA